MTTRTVEIVVGIFVAIGLAALFMLAMKVSNLSAFGEEDGYVVKARFDDIGGLKERSPVRLGGVRIGHVRAISYDQKTYEAVVTMVIDKGYDKVPKDSAASIYTSGLLGEQFMGLEPGADTRYLADGDVIRFTQSALVLEKLISKFLVNQVSEGGGR